ncbi:MAG TPA: endonuclease domain-containing protein [Candidatus Limnocylindrales bacterium]|nr:endonuclease domain-containing protein [Candidatus Limnocylindrales bacterium]
MIDLFAAQDGRCAICSVKLTTGRTGVRRACLDHDHQTGKVRGFVCANCNFRLSQFEGVLQMSEDYAASILAYLQRHRAVLEPRG